VEILERKKERGIFIGRYVLWRLAGGLPHFPIKHDFSNKINFPFLSVCVYIYNRLPPVFFVGKGKNAMTPSFRKGSVS
jgi:hypothetical protein